MIAFDNKEKKKKKTVVVFGSTCELTHSYIVLEGTAALFIGKQSWQTQPELKQRARFSQTIPIQLLAMDTA